MRALLLAAVAAFFMSASSVHAQECYTESEVIADLQGIGAQLYATLQKEEIAALLANLPPAPPELKVDESSTVQVWLKHDAGRIIFFDAKGCANTKIDMDAATIIALIG